MIDRPGVVLANGCLLLHLGAHIDVAAPDIAFENLQILDAASAAAAAMQEPSGSSSGANAPGTQPAAPPPGSSSSPGAVAAAALVPTLGSSNGPGGSSSSNSSPVWSAPPSSTQPGSHLPLVRIAGGAILALESCQLAAPAEQRQALIKVEPGARLHARYCSLAGGRCGCYVAGASRVQLECCSCIEYRWYGVEAEGGGADVGVVGCRFRAAAITAPPPDHRQVLVCVWVGGEAIWREGSLGAAKGDWQVPICRRGAARNGAGHRSSPRCVGCKLAAEFVCVAVEGGGGGHGPETATARACVKCATGSAGAANKRLRCVS